MAKKDKATQDFEKRLKQQNLEITGQASTMGNKENKTGKKHNRNTNDNFNSRVLRQNREVANAPLIGDYRPNNKKQIKGGVSEATIYANTPKMPSLPSNYGTKDYYKRQIEKTQNDIKRMTGNALNRDNGSSASRMGMYSDIRDKSERIQEYKNNLKLINAKEVFDKGIIGRNESTPYDDPEIVANFTDWRGKRTKSYYNAIENLKKRGVSDEQAEGLLYYYSLRSDDRKKIDDRDKATLDITGGKVDNIGMPGRIARGILSGMGSAIAQPLDSAINNFSDMQYDDTYIAKQSGLDNTSKSEAQQEAATKGMNKVGTFFYQNAEGLAEMGTTMVASGGNGVLTNLMFAGRGADDAYNTAINNGADQKQAAEYGLLKGFAEYLIYSKGIPKLKSMTPTSLAGSIFKDSGTMFSMSVASQAADAVAQTGVLGDKSTYAKQYDNLIKEGYSKDEAKRRMVMQLGQQLGKTAIGSLFSGAVIGTGKWGYSKLNPVENRPAVQGNDNEALTEEEAKYYEGITNEKDLKRRYYKYSKEYHPDSVTSRGMELNEDIINKWNTIKSAYEKINKNFDGANGATADEISKKVEEYRAYVRNYENMKNNTWTAKAKEKLNSIKESLKKMKSGSSSENIKRTAEEMINDVDEKVGKMDEVAPQTVEKPVEEFNARSNADEVESNGIVPENTESRLQEEKIDELVDNKAAEGKVGVPESVSLETQKEDITSQRPINEQLMSVAHKIEDNAETSVQSSDEKVAESKKVVDISEAPISTKKAYIPDAVKMTDEEIHTSVQNGSYHPKYTLGNRVVTNKGTGYIQEIVKTGSESRQVIVNYDNGSSDVETMDAFNDIVDNPKEAMLYTFAVDFGYNGANTFIQSAPKDISRSISVMNRYSVNAHEMYEAGKNKLDFKDTFDNGVSFFMHKDMAQKFYRAGVMDRKDLAAVEMSRKLSSKTEPKNTISTKQSRGENVKADSKDISNYKEINIEDVFEKLSDGQKNEIEVINKISEATGVKVKYFESKAGENGKLEMANGFFDRKKNEIWIDINAGRNIKDIGRTTMVKTMSHELTHFIAKWSEEQYGSLEKYVLNLLEEKTGKAQKELIKDKMKQLNVKEDVAREEIIADACEMMLKDSKAIEQLAKENRTLFNKIKEWLHNFVESIKKAFEGVKATSEEAKAIMEYMEDVQEKWDNTMVEAVKNMNNIHHKGVSTSGKDYKETINSDLAEFVERNKIADQKETHRISEKISMKLASDIKTLLGIDVSDYANEIDSDSIIHINKDHGINGKSDHSMGDLSEIEHIEYILENYEDIEVGLGSKKYKNRDNSHAKTVVLTAKIENSNIYVVEAVPDTNKKVLKVVSEYKKETALQVNHSKNTPHRTSKNELASAVSNNSIAQESENDNNILKQDRNTDVIKKAANKLGVSERFLESNLEGRSRESAVQYLRNNNQVKNSFISEKGLEVTPVLKEPTSSYGMSDNIKEFVRDNNISYKTLSENSRLREEYAKLIEHSKDGSGKKFLVRRAQDKAQEFIEDINEAMSGDTEAKEKISREIELAKDEVNAYDDGMSMERGQDKLIKEYNTEFEEFISSNIAPMYNNAERNKKEFAQNVKDNVESYVEKAEKHFGTTNDYSLAAYIDINGKMLDFSDGGAIRGTDHRGIAEVLDTPSGVSGTEALTAFMNAGNIRIMDTGIDISVEPNEKQISVLRDYIASRNGEIYVDFSKEDGSPAGSARYSKGTSVSRILADINNYFEDGTIPENTYNAMSDFLYQNRRNTDSEGNELTLEQQEYFKDSKVRDDEGRLMVMYHGTPTGGFTVFKNDLQFFTPNKEYASFYEDPSASSRKSGKEKTNPQTYEVYLNMEHPFDIRDEETRELFINDYVKGGWALGINPYEEYKDTTKTGLPSWEEADNIYEWLEENEMLDDYDGIVVDEGGFLGEDNNVVDRGISYVTFNSNQIKNVTNENPTNNEDIRYQARINAITDAESMTQDNGIASYTEERLEDLYTDYAAMNEDYSQAYLTRLSPEEFLKLTTEDDAAYNRIVSEAGKLDREKIKKNSQPIYLRIYDDGEVKGHEGRHRMAALMDAGITSVPVVLLENSDNYGKEIGDIQKLDSQDFSFGRRDYSVKLEDSIPITRKNDALIREKFLNDDNEKVEVRFSLRNVDSDADLVLEDLAPIIEENEKLKRQNELLEQQFIVTKGHKPKVEDVTKMCKKILKKYSSDYNLDDMVSNFKNIIDISSSSKFSNYAATREALMTVAESVLKQSKNIDMVEYEQYAPLRKTLRTTRIVLNEQQMQEAQNIAGSYNDYRKKLFGKVKLVKEGGIQLDSLWQELSEKYPEEFSRDTSDVNQVHELMDIVESIKQAKVTNTFNDEQELSMASYELMEDMVQEYFSLPTVETFADARIHELQEAREEYKQGIDEARQVYNEKYQKKVYKEQIKRLRNNLVSKIVNKKTVPFGLVDKTIDVLNEIYMGGVNISDVEKKTISQLMKSRVHGTKLTDVEAKQIVEKCSEILMGRADESVGRSEDRVVKWLLSIGYSDIQSRDIINICHDNYFTLAATNKIEKQIHRKLKMVQDAYSNFRKEDVPYEYSSEYDDRLNNLLQEVTDTVQDKAVISLDNYELDRLYKALKELSHVIIDATNQIDDVKGRTNYERGVEIINEIRSRGGKNAYKTNNYVRKYALNSQRYINSITNWDKNSPLAQLINPVLEATRTKDKVTMDLKKPFDRLMADKEYDAFVGKRKGSLIEGAFFDRKGKPLTISHSQLVQIIMTWERNQGKGHLMASGATVYDVEQLLKGNIVKAVDMSHDTSPFKEKTIDRLREYLNDYDEAWIEAARTLFRVAGDLTNEVTMKTRGVPIAMDPNYCPIISDRAYLKTESSKVKRDATLEGQGRLKETTLHASNPVVIMGIEKLIDKTISESSSYYAYTVPLKNARKALNVTLAENKDSVRRAVRQVMGENTMNRIDRILDEIETGRAIDNSRDEFQKEFGFLYSNFVAAALNTNISVSIKQFASYPTAMAYIKERNLIKALAHGVDLDEIDKYTGAHYKRRLGLSHMELDIIQKSSKLQEVFDKLPGLLNGRKWIAAVDCFTTSRLWTACKYEVKGSGVKPDTDEFWRKTTELYHKVLEDTQPMYDVQYRTGIQKTNNIVAKTLAMFKTQPLQTFGMLYDAYGEMKATGKRFKKSKSEENRNAYKNAKKRFYNGAIRALINSAVLFSALTFVANLAVNKTSAWRDKDTGEMTIESVLSNLVKNSIAGVAGMAIPVIGDRAYQMLTGDYYDMEEPTLTMINEAYQAINKLYEYASKIASGEKEFSISELLSNIETMAYDISSLCGIETKNIANIIKSSVYYVGHAVGNKSIENKLGYQFKSTQLYTSYYEALMKGDKDKAEQIKSKALDGNDDYSKFDTGVKNVLIDSDGRVTEAANAYINKDYEQYEKIINEIVSSGFKKDVAIKAVESVINSLTKKEGESNKGDTDDEKFMYSVNDLVDAIMSDNKEAYDYIMNNLISAGKEADKLESSVKTKLKARFKDGNLKQNQAEQYLKDFLGYDNLKVYQTINNWKNKNDYSDLTEALRNGDTDLAQKYMELLYSRGNGKSTEAIRNGITSALKGEYIYKYYTGGEYTKMAYNILDAVEYLGFDREQYAENIEKWPTGADCYNSMNYYIAACDTKNAQNEIYDLYYTQNKKKSTILNAIESTYKPMYVYMKNNDMSTKEIKKTLIDCAVFLGENKEQYSSKIDDWE